MNEEQTVTPIPDVKFAGAAFHSLPGRSVIVTGGASGIGADIVRAFAEQGCRVGFVDRDWRRRRAGGRPGGRSLRALRRD